MAENYDERGWPVRALCGVRVCSRTNCQQGDSMHPDWGDNDPLNHIPDKHHSPPSTEFRIDGYCSCECRDMHGLEVEIRALQAENAALREKAEALEALLVRVDSFSTAFRPGSFHSLWVDIRAALAQSEGRK